MRNLYRFIFAFVAASAVLLMWADDGWQRGAARAQSKEKTPAASKGPVAGAPVTRYGVIWDDKLSRSGMPEDDGGWKWMRDQGVNTIDNFRQENDVDYGKFGFESFLWIPLSGGRMPTDTDAEKFLRFIQDTDNSPVHLQCAEGKDRTGMMAALARYAVDGWSMDDALGELGLYLGNEELPARQLDWLRLGQKTQAGQSPVEQGSVRIFRRALTIWKAPPLDQCG